MSPELIMLIFASTIITASTLAYFQGRADGRLALLDELEAEEEEANSTKEPIE